MLTATPGAAVTLTAGVAEHLLGPGVGAAVRGLGESALDRTGRALAGAVAPRIAPRTRTDVEAGALSIYNPDTDGTRSRYIKLLENLNDPTRRRPGYDIAYFWTPQVVPLDGSDVVFQEAAGLIAFWGEYDPKGKEALNRQVQLMGASFLEVVSLMAANARQDAGTNIFAAHTADADKRYRKEFAKHMETVYRTIGMAAGNDSIRGDLKKMSDYANEAVDKKLPDGSDEYSFIGVLTYLDEKILFPTGFTETPLGLLLYPAHRGLFYGDAVNAIDLFETNGVDDWRALRAWGGKQFNLFKRELEYLTIDEDGKDNKQNPSLAELYDDFFAQFSFNEVLRDLWTNLDPLTALDAKSSLPNDRFDQELKKFAVRASLPKADGKRVDEMNTAWNNADAWDKATTKTAPRAFFQALFDVDYETDKLRNWASSYEGTNPTAEENRRRFVDNFTPPVAAPAAAAPVAPGTAAPVAPGTAAAAPGTAVPAASSLAPRPVPGTGAGAGAAAPAALAASAVTPANVLPADAGTLATLKAELTASLAAETKQATAVATAATAAAGAPAAGAVAAPSISDIVALLAPSGAAPLGPPDLAGTLPIPGPPDVLMRDPKVYADFRFGWHDVPSQVDRTQPTWADKRKIRLGEPVDTLPALRADTVELELGPDQLRFYLNNLEYVAATTPRPAGFYRIADGQQLMPRGITREQLLGTSISTKHTVATKLLENLVGDDLARFLSNTVNSRTGASPIKSELADVFWTITQNAEQQRALLAEPNLLFRLHVFAFYQVLAVYLNIRHRRIPGLLKSFPYVYNQNLAESIFPHATLREAIEFSGQKLGASPGHALEIHSWFAWFSHQCERVTREFDDKEKFVVRAMSDNSTAINRALSRLPKRIPALKRYVNQLLQLQTRANGTRHRTASAYLLWSAAHPDNHSDTVAAILAINQNTIDRAEDETTLWEAPSGDMVMNGELYNHARDVQG